MKMRSLVWLVLGMAALALPLAAQDIPAQVLFVSHLQGEVKNNLVRLSWEDSPDARGPVYIYRSSLPLEGDGPFLGTGPLLGVRPIRVPYGVQYYVDEIESGAAIYYFVVASDETGRTFDVRMVPGNYISVQPLAGSIASAVPETTRATAAPRAGAGTTTEIPRGISSLEAAAEGDKVIISFAAGPENSGVNNAVLYRSVQPINATADLLGAVIIQTHVRSPAADYPVPGIPYYYAVVDGEDLIRGTVAIVPGQNATAAPIRAAASGGQGIDSSGRDMRVMPLPEISIQAVVPGINAYPGPSAPAELSPLAARVLGNIPARPLPAPSLKEPRIFTRDTEAPRTGGEDYTLALIVKGSFSAKNWEAARDELVRFLALPRSSEAQARARFYLGQCSYFLRRPGEGLFEFLAAGDRYPVEAAEWIQASLDMMTEKSAGIYVKTP